MLNLVSDLNKMRYRGLRIPVPERWREPYGLILRLGAPGQFLVRGSMSALLLPLPVGRGGDGVCPVLGAREREVYAIRDCCTMRLG